MNLWQRYICPTTLSEALSALRDARGTAAPILQKPWARLEASLSPVPRLDRAAARMNAGDEPERRGKGMLGGVLMGKVRDGIETDLKENLRKAREHLAAAR